MTRLTLLAALLPFTLSAQQANTNTTLDTVRVRAARERAMTSPVVRSATRTPTRLLDLPMALTAIPRRQMDEQSMQSMADVLRYVPGALMGQGEGHRDQPTIRGISSTADLYIDGVRDDAQYLRDVYNTDRVEALRGPNALAFGRGGGGGVLNRVLRTADFASHRALAVERGSYDHTRGTLDVGGRLGTRLSTRLNAMGHASSSFRGTSVDRAGVNPVVAVVAGGGLLRAAFERFEDRRTVDRGIPSLRGAPAPVAHSAFYGDRVGNTARAVVDHARMEYDRGFSAGTNLRTVLTWSQYDKMYQNTVPGAMNAAGTTVALNAYRNETDRRNRFVQSDLTWRRRHGGVEHLVLVGGEAGVQSTANFRETGYFGTATSVLVSAAGTGAAPAITYRQSASDASNGTRASIASAYAQHQGTLGRFWQTTLGVRVERIAIRFENYRNDQRLDRADVLVSPRAGLVFKPREHASLYASYATSALPSAGDQFSSLTATTAALEPERFATREIGAKWQPTPRVLVSGAFYALTRSRATSPDPLRPGAVIQTGAQESRGVELDVQGELLRGWSVSGAVTLQRARITSRTTTAAVGATIPLVPARSISVWNHLQLARGMSAGLGVVHQGRSYAAVDNTVTLPAFTRLDGAFSAQVTPRLTAQVNVENMQGVRYFATAHANNNIQPGAPRTVRVTLSAR